MSRAPLVALCALFAVLPEGCAPSLREVMLIVTTDIPCPETPVDAGGFDRVEVVLSRAGSEAVTYAQTFMREECLPAGSNEPARAQLGPGREMRLGLIDSQRSDARVRIEVRGRNTAASVVTSISETDFVDGKVYGLRVFLSANCISPPACGSDASCYVNPDGQAACGRLYRAPGTPVTAVE